MRKRRQAILLGLVIGQVCVGMVLLSFGLTNTRTLAAASHTILVGPGFSDVSPHQIVRTSDNRLWVVGQDGNNTTATADGSHASKLHLYRADQTGTPSSFTEQDAAHAPGFAAGTSNSGVITCALAVDGSDTLRVAWLEKTSATAGTLKYQAISSASPAWNTPVVLDGATHWGGDQGAEGVALALDAAGAPHVAYTKSDGSHLRVAYLNKVGGNWSSIVPAVDDAAFGNNQGAWHPTLAFYPNGDLLLAWYVGSFNYTPDGTIYFRTRTHTNGAWGVHTTIIGDTLMSTIDNGPSLLITPDGIAHVTFLNVGSATGGDSTTGDYIHYYYNSGSVWVPNHPGGGMQITHDPSLGLGPNGTLRIYGHDWQGGRIDGHGNDLRYFEGAGGAGAWGGWTLYTTGSFDSSVSTRWAQFFQTFPQTLDIAYWADAYPNTLYVGTDTVGSAPPTPTPLPPIPSPTPTPLPPTSSPPQRPGPSPSGAPIAAPLRRIDPSATDQGVPNLLPTRR